MKIINVSPGTDEWLWWRSQGVTATDSVILLDRSPYKTRWRLWAEKTGYAKPVDLSMNPLVRKGIKNEDKARQALENELGDILIPICVESSVDPLVRASLDGATSRNEPAEIKCPSQAVFEDVLQKGVDSAAYRMYEAQVQHQLLATGSLQGYLFFWFEGRYKLFIIRADRLLLADLYQKIKCFWHQVTTQEEPTKDPERDLYIPQGEEARQWIQTADQYRFFEEEIQSLKRRLSDLEEKQKPCLETLKGMMGEYFHADYCGLMITKYRVRGKVNMTRVLEDRKVHVTSEQLEQYRDEPSIRYRVTMDNESVMPRHVVDETVIEPLLHVQAQSERFFF